MDGNSHVMNDILYENTGYLSLPFHDIYAKKEGRQLILTARKEHIKIQHYL